MDSQALPVRTELIEETTALCIACGESHRAEIIVQDNRVSGLVLCPRGTREYLISTDAALFLHFRRLSFTDLSRERTKSHRYVLNYIPITDACNFGCSICGADAKQDLQKATFLSADEVRRRAELVKRDGGHMINLTGGEPTLHPQLFDIIGQLRALGLSLGMNTNGYLLGKDETLAPRLRKSGLNRVIIQFDSFNEEALRQLGRNYLPEKRKAVANAASAGLKIGLNCLVTRHNLPELDRLLGHGLDLGAAVISLAFASPAPVGRYALERSEVADREAMVTQLLKAGEKYHFSLDDFLPLPSCLPWGLEAHPDCGVHAVFVRTPGGIYPLSRSVDTKRLYRSLSRIPDGGGMGNRYVRPVLSLLGSLRPGARTACLRIAVGLVFSKRRYSLVNVGLANYDAAGFLDDRRISRCAAAFYMADGPVKGCLLTSVKPSKRGVL